MSIVFGAWVTASSPPSMGATAAVGSHRSPSVDVELARDRMAAIGRTPQDDKLAHPYAETGQVGHHAAVCHQYQRRSTTVSSDGFLDLGKLALTEFHVVERALQDIPRLRLPEGQTGGVQASAARAGQHRADCDGVLPKRVTNPPGLRPAAFVQVALGRAVVEPGVGRIESTGGKAVAQDHDAAGRARGFPDRLRGVRDGYCPGAQDNYCKPSNQDRWATPHMIQQSGLRRWLLCRSLLDDPDQFFHRVGMPGDDEAVGRVIGNDSQPWRDP